MAEEVVAMMERPSPSYVSCRVDINAGSGSPPTPHDTTLLYQSREIVKFRNTKAQDFEDVPIQCLRVNNHIYVFLITLVGRSASCRVLKLCDLLHVTYSLDNGTTWSPFRSLNKIAVAASRFHRDVRVLSDSDHHVIAVYNGRDRATYLFNPEFELVKTISPFQRLTDRIWGPQYDFHFHNGVIYVGLKDCKITRVYEMIGGYDLECSNNRYLETSKDLGETWQRTRMPYANESYFLTVNDSLYQFYKSSCEQTVIGVLIPALGNYRCGTLNVRQLDSDGEWTQPVTLVRTAGVLEGVYLSEKATVVWRDLRFLKPRVCGFLPIIGCIDAEPHNRLTVRFAGKLDPESLQLSEVLISPRSAGQIH